MKLILNLPILFNLLFITLNQDESLLKGTILSSDDNSNLIKFAFDNRLMTQFKSELESNGWVGIDFRSKNIITRIEWGVNDTNHSTYLLGIFEGANEKNFEDAIPLYMITSNGKLKEMNNVDIKTKKSIQYIRYIGPSGKYCKINNIRIYGYSADKDGDNSVYYNSSNLPLLVIHSSSGKLPIEPKDKLDATFNLIYDKSLVLDKIKGYIKIKGSRDLNLNKQSYFFELVQYEKFLDFKTKSNKWTLVSNYGDKTLLRNFVALELSRKLEMDYTIDCKPIDLMVNGEYKGTYNLCENVDVSENKVNIEKMDKDDLKEPELTGGYLLEINGFAYFGNHYINSKSGLRISIYK